MNTSDSYTLEDIMKASPFRENLRSAPLFDIDTFFQDFFVHDSNYDKIALDISKEIDDKPTYYDPFILLFNGYAGTGKTTFMHWFCSKYRYDKIKNSTYYKHAFLDFEKVGGPDCDYGFKEQIKSELKNVFAKICVKCEKSVEDLLNHLLDNPDEYASLESFFKVAKDFSSNKHKTRFVELFDAMEYLDLFLLLLLYYNKNEEYFIEALNGSITPETNTKRLLLVVDNLDSITVSIDARYTPNKFLSAYRKYLRIINNTSNKYFSNDIGKQIDLIYCLRDTSRVHINDPHLEDGTNVVEKSFRPDCLDGMERYSRRIVFAERNIKYNPCIKSIFNRICGKIEDQDTATDSYLSMVNSNHRKFAIHLCRALLSDAGIESFRQITVLEDKIGARKFTFTGIKGTVYYLMLDYMNRIARETNFFNSILCNDRGRGRFNNGSFHLNPARIILSILRNHEEEPGGGVALMDVYEDYCKIFSDMSGKEEVFCHTISELFLFHRTEWSHFLTISGKIKSVYDIKDLAEEIEILKKYHITGNEGEKVNIRNKMNDFTLILNEAGRTYIKDICRHYEFYSQRAGNRKPLFSATSIINGHEYEFIRCIEKTCQLAWKCILELNSILAVKEYEELEFNKYCFFESPSVKQLFVNRIIDFHTHYLDQFRIYITHYPEMLKKYSDEIGKRRGHIIWEINDSLLNCIEKYIDMYHMAVGESDGYESWLSDFQRKNIKRIRRGLSENEGYTVAEGIASTFSINENREEEEKKRKANIKHTKLSVG